MPRTLAGTDYFKYAQRMRNVGLPANDEGVVTFDLENDGWE